MNSSRCLKTGLFLLLTSGPLLLLGGCSLTSIVDIRVHECPSADDEGDRRCQEVLNPTEGFYEGCAAFKCVELDDYFQCQRVEGEICDGEDNDCDYLIDESVSGKALLKANTRSLVSGVERVETVSLAESENFGRSLYIQEPSDLIQVALDGDSSTSLPVTLRTQKADPNPTSQADLTQLQDGCYPAGSTPPGKDSCSPQQSVATAGQNLAYFAYSNATGCTSGELRVGIVEQGQHSEFIDRGLGARAPSYRGVATQGSRCSDNRTEACSTLKAQDAPDLNELSQVCGVSQPAIAALSKQALVAYLGTKLSATSCPSSDANVLSLAVHESSATFSSTIYWGNPSGDGLPDIIGKTRSGRAPAVTAFADQGFVVAHGAADGGLRLVWVPSQDKPAKTAGTTCPDNDCDSREGVETLPLSGVVELITLQAKDSAVADGIALSVLPLTENKVGLLLTWVDGCALVDGDLNLSAYAQLLHLDIGGSKPELVEEFAVVSLGKTNKPPLGIPSDDDFVVTGFSRNGQQASNDTRGGFFVFTETDSTDIVRIAAFDGDRVDDDEVISSSGWSYLTELEPSSIVGHDEEAGELKSVTLACGN